MRIRLLVASVAFVLLAGETARCADAQPAETIKALLTPGSKWTYAMALADAKGQQFCQFSGWVTAVGLNAKAYGRAAVLSPQTTATFVVSDRGPAVAPKRIELLTGELPRVGVTTVDVTRPGPFAGVGVASLDFVNNVGLYASISEESLCWIPLSMNDGGCLLAEEGTWQDPQGSAGRVMSRTDLIGPSGEEVTSSVDTRTGSATPLAAVRCWAYVPSTPVDKRHLVWGVAVESQKGTSESYYRVYAEPEQETVVTPAGRFERCIVTTIECGSRALQWREKSWFRADVGIVRWVQSAGDEGAIVVSLDLKEYRLSRAARRD